VWRYHHQSNPENTSTAVSDIKNICTQIIRPRNSDTAVLGSVYQMFFILSV
jgi:hypothetical protein